MYGLQRHKFNKIIRGAKQTPADLSNGPGTIEISCKLGSKSVFLLKILDFVQFSTYSACRQPTLCRPPYAIPSKLLFLFKQTQAELSNAPGPVEIGPEVAENEAWNEIWSDFRPPHGWPLCHVTTEEERSCIQSNFSR